MGNRLGKKCSISNGSGDIIYIELAATEKLQMKRFNKVRCNMRFFKCMFAPTSRIMGCEQCRQHQYWNLINGWSMTMRLTEMVVKTTRTWRQQSPSQILPHLRSATTSTSSASSFTWTMCTTNHNSQHLRPWQMTTKNEKKNSLTAWWSTLSTRWDWQQQGRITSLQYNKFH